MRIRVPLIILLSCLIGLTACKKKKLEEPSSFSVEVEDLPEPQSEQPDKIEPDMEADQLAKPVPDPVPSVPVRVQVVRKASDHVAGTVGQVQLIRVFADRFNRLKRKDRVLSYHLVRALQAGRDIHFDQIHPRGLEIRKLTERVLRGLRSSGDAIEDGLGQYLQLLAIHGGFYGRYSGRKFVPSFDFDSFTRAVHRVSAEGAEVSSSPDESLEEMLSRLRPTMFDGDFEAQLYPSANGGGRQALSSSPPNLYRGVSRRALRKFDEHFPYNSRLISVDGRLVEQVYRAGDRRRKIAPGRYFRILRRVLKRLQDATSSAGRGQRLIVSELSEYLRSGDPFAFDAVVRLWQERVSGVEFILGFIDRTVDPRRTKGLYGGLVGYLDRAATTRLESLFRYAQYFEEQMPWAQDLRSKWSGAPKFAAVHLLSQIGLRSPGLRFSFALDGSLSGAGPHDRKIVLFSNVVTAYQQAVDLPLASIFLAEKDRAEAPGILAVDGFTRIAVRELLGRNLGREHPELAARLGRDLDTMRALKAELVSLWLLADPKLAELGLVSSSTSYKLAWDMAVIDMVVAESLVGDDPLWSKAQARRIILRSLMEESSVVEVSVAEGELPRFNLQHSAFRDALGVLMIRCQRIMAQGDRPGARTLISRFRGPPAGEWWPVIAERARSLGLRRHMALVMPKLKPRRSTISNRIEEATVSHSEGFRDQLLRISRY